MRYRSDFRDLSNTENWGPCKISHVTNPHIFGADSLNGHIIRNIEELRDLLTQVQELNTDERLNRRIEELEQFFATMNKGNDLDNALAYGDANIEGDGALSGRLRTLDRKIQVDAQRGPQYEIIRNFWNDNKARIPEKMEMLRLGQLESAPSSALQRDWYAVIEPKKSMIWRLPRLSASKTPETPSDPLIAPANPL